MVWTSLAEASRQALETFMQSGTYQYQSEFARKYVAEGKAEGKAEGEAQALLTILTARGLAITEEQRTRIQQCQDLPTLETWLQRAVSAASVAEVLG